MRAQRFFSEKKGVRSEIREPGATHPSDLPRVSSKRELEQMRAQRFFLRKKEREARSEHDATIRAISRAVSLKKTM